MNIRSVSRFFSLSHPTRTHFALGIAMVSVIPILLLVYFLNRDLHVLTTADIWFTATLLGVMAISVTGYIMLRRHPVAIQNLRELLQDRISDEVSHKADLIKSEPDARAIEKGIHILLDELRTRVLETEAATSRLQQKLHQEKKLESLNTMALGLSHDFNNHLTAVLGNVAIIRQRLPPDSPSQEHVQQIEASAISAVELLNQMALFSGQVFDAPFPIEINDLIRETISGLKERMPKTAGIHLDLAESLPVITGDHGSIRRMLINLLQNSIEAGHRAGTVTISTGVADLGEREMDECIFNEALPPGRCVFVQITDRGCGIPPEIHDRIFDPFFSTKMRAQGMGLPVVLGIVRAHGGAIRIRSKPREGCSFAVFFPAGPA